MEVGEKISSRFIELSFTLKLRTRLDLKPLPVCSFIFSFLDSPRQLCIKFKIILLCLILGLGAALHVIYCLEQQF